jgi:hypothetical protein
VSHKKKKKRHFLVIALFFFWWDWGLNSGHHVCKAGILPLEPHLQSILLWLFWRWGSHELFACIGFELKAS